MSIIISKTEYSFPALSTYAIEVKESRNVAKIQNKNAKWLNKTTQLNIIFFKSIRIFLKIIFNLLLLFPAKQYPIDKKVHQKAYQRIYTF